MSPPPTSQREDYDKDADTAVAMTDHLDRQNAYGDAALDPVATPSVSQTQVQPVKRKRGRPPKPKPDASQSTRVQDASSSSKAPACPTPPSSLRQLPAADSSNHDSASMSTITVVNGFTWCSRCQSELNQDKAGLSPLDFSHCLHASQGASANVYSKEEGKEVEPGCGCLETLLEQSEGSDHRMPSLLLLSSNKSNQLTPSTDSAALMNEDSDSSAEGGEASTLVSVSPTSKNLSAKPLAKDLLPSDDASATVGEKASAPDLVCESCSRNGLSKVHLVGALHVCSDCADIFRDAGAMRSGRRSTSSLPPVNQKQSGTYNNNAVTKVKKQAGSSNKNASDEKIAGQSQHGPQQDDANHTWSKPRARTRTADDDSIIVVDDDTVLSAPAQEGTFMMPESFTEGMSGNAPKGDKAPLAQSALVTLSSHMSESTQSLDAATTLTPPVPKKRGRPRKVVPIVPPAESSPATKPEISISKKESKVSAATTAAPKTASQSSGTSSTPSFMTTGAFLTRTASKLLLSGQQAQAVDCNVYGYAYGRKVRVRHRDGTFYFGSMIDLDHDRIRVRYDGWSEEWDEWINSESRRLHVLSPEQVKEYEASLQTNDSTPVQATTAKEKKMATEAEAKTKEVVMSAGPQCTGDDEGTSEILASTSNKSNCATYKKRKEAGAKEKSLPRIVIDLSEVRPSKTSLLPLATEEDATTNDAAEPPAVVMDDRLEPNNDAEDAHPTSTFHEASNTTTTPSKPTQVEALELHTEDPLPTSCPSPSPENSAPSSSVPSALKAKHKPSTEGSAFQGWRIEALLQASKEESESTSPSQASNPPPRTDVDNNTGATASESTAAAPASTSQTNTTAKTATKKKKLDVSLSSEIQQLLDRVPLGTRVQIRSKNGKQMHDATVVLVHDKKICLHFEQVNARSGMARDDIWLNVTSRRIFVEGKPLRVVDKEKAGLDDGDDGDDDNDGDNGYMGAYSSSDHSRGEKENQPLHADTGSDTAPRRTIEVVIEVPVRKKMADMDPNALLASSPPVTNSKKRKAPSAIVALDGSVERPLTASPADTVVTPSVGVGSPKKKTTKSPKSSTPVSNDETRGIKKGKQKKKPSADAPTPTSETRSSDSLSVSPSPPSQKASTSKNQPLPTPNLSNETEQLSPPPSGSDSISNTDSKKTAKPVQEIPPLPPPLPITAFEFEDQTAEVLKIVHHILDSGAIVNKIIPVQEEEEILPRYFRNMSKARKRKLQELLKDAKEGKLDLNDIPGKGGEGGEAGEGTGGGGDGEGEEDYQPNFDENGEPTEHLLRRLGYHIPSVASEAVTYRDELDGCDYVVNEWVKPATPEVRKIRQDAMRNMTRIPLFQYVRQITYGTEHYDHEIELRDDLTRRKRLAKKLQASSIGLKLAEKIDPEALMNESSETSAKIQKALERYKKKIKKKREKRLLESMKDPDAEETVVASQGKFQNLRSLTRTKKRPRLLKEDHIAFLRKRYTPGTRIRARDKQMEWLVAVVRDLRNSRVLVHYEGFSEYYNEWIDINSERLRFDPTLVQKSPEPEQPPAVAPEEPVPEETVAAPEETPEAGNKKKPRKKAASKKGKEVPPVEEPPAAPKESDQPVFDEGDMISVDCVQCHVQLTQFRYCCTYCEKEEGGEPFNLCLWCFSSAFPEDHDHPRNSFAVKRVLGSNIAKPVAGEIITKFERETFDLTYQEPQMTYQAMNPEDPDSPWNAMDGSGLGNGQAFTFMQQWKQRKICAFCNDDDTTKDHFIGPHPFIFSSTNRYGDEKKKNFWAHDACARYSPEVIQDRNGSWFNVATAMRRGRNNKCAACREKGATIGCFDPKCNRSFHIPCTGRPLARFEDGVIFWCPQHEKELERRVAYHENFSCDSCSKILGVNPWWTCQPCSDDYFHSFDLCTQCFDTREIDHDHDKEDFEITSLEMKRKERLAQKAAQAKAKEDSAKKKPVNNRPKFKGLSSKMCSYCWSTNSSKWRKVYNGVLMCEDCFMAGPVINQSLPPLVNGLEGDTAAPEIAPISGGVGRYATNAEDYSHSPYFTRTTVSADRFDHSQSQAVYLDSYGPAEHQLYSLTIDTTYYDIPGRAPRWATHSGTDYHGTWLPQTVRRAVSRWTKPNDRVLSNFLGRGTDAIECFLLGRRCTAVDINPAAITLSIRNCSFAIPPDSTIKAEHRPIIMQGDSRKLVGPLFEDESFDHVLSHPPYKDCVAYSTHIEGDLSRFNNAAEFQREMKNVIQETYRLLKMGRRCTLGIGDNREHCFYIPVSFQLIRQYIDGGFELEELIVKRQRYCAMFGLGTYLCVQFDFLCFTHEFIATLRKVPKENHDRMILEPDDSLLRKIKVSSIVRSIPSCPIERKSVVMGSVWTFKPNKEYDFPTLCISRMVERFGRNDANWEEFKLELNVTSTFNDDDHDEEGLDASYTHHELLQTAQIDEEDNLVSYERDRLQQIQENNRMLLALGLITELSETSDDIGHQQKILREEPCLSDAETALMCIAHVPGVGSNMAHHTSSTICLRTREQIDVYRMAVMDLARKARERLPVTGVFVVGVQDIRTRDNKLYPLSMLVLEDIIRVIGETHLRLKELIEVVPDGYQKDRRKVTSWEEYQEEPNWPEDHIPNQHLPIVHACYLVFIKVKEYNPTHE